MMREGGGKEGRFPNKKTRRTRGTEPTQISFQSNQVDGDVGDGETFLMAMRPIPKTPSEWKWSYQTYLGGNRNEPQETAMNPQKQKQQARPVQRPRHLYMGPL